MEEQEPDYIFNDHPLEEKWWAFESDSGIEVGDEVSIKTTRTERKNPLVIIDERYGDYILETKHGTKYLLTLSKLHPLEPYMLTFRVYDGYQSLGEVEEVKVYKNSE